jgi:hypothetical protein
MAVICVSFVVHPVLGYSPIWPFVNDLSELLPESRRVRREGHLANLLKTSRIGEILRESLTIGGWVSMWRPLEVFLYDWWPIRNEARLSDRLAAMPVRVRYLSATSEDAWKADWPAVTPAGARTKSEQPPDC